MEREWAIDRRYNGPGQCNLKERSVLATTVEALEKGWPKRRGREGDHRNKLYTVCRGDVAVDGNLTERKSGREGRRQ